MTISAMAHSHTPQGYCRDAPEISSGGIEAWFLAFLVISIGLLIFSNRRPRH